MNYQELINKMTLEEKASLLSGADFWHTKAIERLDIPSIMMTDGPHGLRKQTDDATGVHCSVPATCFPTAVTTSSSWDKELLFKLGEAIGREAKAEDVAIVLGPGVNIKRSPLGGRNFEYFSEDPHLAGKMAANFIRGVESQGIGTSLKHFAANNQEERRMTVSAVVDERTLREIYLKQFEIAVKEGKPSTLMCSYNKINGVYSSENPFILDDVLRRDWKYEGAVMTDWGAVNNRVIGVKSGLDLEMPGSNGINDEKIVKAVNDGSLDIKYVDKAVLNILKLINRGVENRDSNATYDIDEHNALAEDIAANSAVLLKNKDNILPLDKDEKILVLGSLAEHPRYQGAGSSHINAHRITSLLDGLKAIGVDVEYAPAYSMDSRVNSENMIASAIHLALNYDKIILCVGLTDEYEAEGFDRKTMELPASHNALIKAVTKLGKKIIVNVECGSPVTMPWIDKVDAVLLSYLGGQATGGAAAKLLYGDINPSGRLAETFPLCLEDTPCFENFPGDSKNVQYREGIYVGYRYYSTANVPVLYPFGYGISYTEFSYSNINIDRKIIDKDTDKIILTVDIENIGDRDGKEVIEVYVEPKNPNIDRPIRELKAFDKVFIKAHEKKTVEIELSRDDFTFYDVDSNAFVVDNGDYNIILGYNVNSPAIATSVTVIDGNSEDKHLSSESWYNKPCGNKVPDKDFEELLRRDIPEPAVLPKKGEFTVDNCFADMLPSSWLARRVSGIVRFGIRKIMKVDKHDSGLEMMHQTFLYSPLRSIPATSQGVLSGDGVIGMVTIFNGHLFKGLNMIFKDMRKQKARKKELDKKKSK